jgi:hypothetical protein
MKKFLAAVALMAAMITPVFGQASPEEEVTPPPSLPAYAERCIPVFGCFRGFEGLNYARPEGGVGWHIWWFKQGYDKDGKVVLYSDGISCRHGVCDIPAFVDWMVANRATGHWSEQYQNAIDKMKALGTLDCVVEKPLCDERKALIDAERPMAEAMFALKANPLQPIPVYVVKSLICTADPTGATCTRPVYEVVNGVKGTKEVARVLVGTTCDMSWKQPSNSDYWALVAPGRTALCTLKK